MANIEQRVSRLEGAYEHLATKADIADLKADIANLKAELLKWVVGVTTAGIGVAATLAATLVRVIGG